MFFHFLAESQKINTHISYLPIKYEAGAGRQFE